MPMRKTFMQIRTICMAHRVLRLAHASYCTLSSVVISRPADQGVRHCYQTSQYGGLSRVTPSKPLDKTGTTGTLERARVKNVAVLDLGWSERSSEESFNTQITPDRIPAGQRTSRPFAPSAGALTRTATADIWSQRTLRHVPPDQQPSHVTGQSPQH